MAEQIVYYMCKYTPIELFAGFGVSCERLEPETDSFDTADSLGHPNMCGYGKGLLEVVMQGKVREVVLVNCCDVVRRVYDILRAEADLDFLYLLDLPHQTEEADIRRMQRQLLELKQAYEAYCGRPFSQEAFREAWSGSLACGACDPNSETIPAAEDIPSPGNARAPGSDAAVLDSLRSPSADVLDAPLAKEYPPQPARFQERISPEQVGEEQGPYISLQGAHSGAFLAEMIRGRMPLAVKDETCVGNRRVVWPFAGVPENQLWEVYAEMLLKQVPCMRMTDVARRKTLGKQAAGVIYHTMKFCDYYGFEYAALSGAQKGPLLKIETDGTRQSLGQLATRLDAFAEGMPRQTGEGQMMNEGKYTVGIDSGSASTDVAVLDPDGKLVGWSVRRTGAGAAAGAEKAMEEALAMAGISRDDVGNIVSTGYGRANVGVGGQSITEITCHARGAHFLAPSVRTVIDIGGQDSKIIRLDENGTVTNFVMNDKCAAGTGRFLEMMARTMEMSMEEMSEKGLRWKEEIQISSMCTVFAESEVVSLIAENKDVADIIHGLNQSVAARTTALLKRVGEEGDYMMTGGVARNKGLVGVLEKRLGKKILVSEYAQLCGAIGAALFARQQNGGE